MKRTSRLTRSAPMTRGGRPKPKKRSAKEFQRIHGSVERVEWINAMPCYWCGVVGYTVNAHVGTAGKGAGRKANADQIANLCCERFGVLGCHEKFDRHLAPFDRRVNRIRVIAQCKVLDAAWHAHTHPTEAA